MKIGNKLFKKTKLSPFTEYLINKNKDRYYKGLI